MLIALQVGGIVVVSQELQPELQPFVDVPLLHPTMPLTKCEVGYIGLFEKWLSQHQTG